MENPPSSAPAAPPPSTATFVGRLLGRVKAGELGTAPDASPGSAPLISARVGWL